LIFGAIDWNRSLLAKQLLLVVVDSQKARTPILEIKSTITIPTQNAPLWGRVYTLHYTES